MLLGYVEAFLEMIGLTALTQETWLLLGHIGSIEGPD